MEDTSIIDLYWARSETAITETELKYGKLCHHIARNILSNREDAEECVNDIFLGAWNAMPSERPSVLSAFLCKITRNLTLKKYDYHHAQKRNRELEASFNELEECLPSENDPEKEYEAKVVAGEISVFLRSLSYEHRIIFLRKYWFLDSISEIAELLSMSEGKVKSILYRTRNQLKEYLERMG